MDQDANGNGVVEMSAEIGELAKALAAAQAEIEGATKDAANPFFNSKYADLASVWGACRGALTKHGLAVVQAPAARENEVSVATTVLHGSGQWMRSTLTLLAKDASPQAIGSAVTYARRYGLSAMVGVAPEDDDGNAAQGTTAPPKPAVRPYHRAPVPRSTVPAAVIGQPDRPSTADPATTERESRALFASPGEDAERASYIKELKRLKTKLKLTDAQTT